MIQLESKHFVIVKNILLQYPYQFYAFGSRVKNTARKLSDLDLCYKEDIPGNIISLIEEAFEESDLPFKVDIVDYQNCSDDFKQLIDQDLQPLVFK